MAKSDELSTDALRSAGDFSCTVCDRKRLPASEFSKNQVQKALEALKSIPDKDLRSGPDIQHLHFVTGVCQTCIEEKEAKERAEAEARRGERVEAVAVAQAEVGAPERIAVTLSERPFGMTPGKAEGAAGYLVIKTSEGKPAARGGVRPGWRVVEVAGKPCGDGDLETVQAVLKAAELPVDVTFETVPSGADFCTACQQVLVAALFSRKMRTKPPDKRRCSACVEAAEGEAENEKDAAEVADATQGDAPKSKLSELQQLCADSAQAPKHICPSDAWSDDVYANARWWRRQRKSQG